MFRARTRMPVLLIVPALVCGVTAGVLPAAAPAQAGESVTVAADQADRYRQMVRRLADRDPRWEVQSAAWSALKSDLPDAVTKFLSPGGGYEEARARAAKNASRNDLIISRTIATTTDKSSPIVHVTAVRASHGTLAEKDRYVRTGLKEAQDLDAKHSPIQQAKQQAQQDRDFVADLALNGSGPWVRAAAQRAVQLGTDADIAEFFKYAWISAADCDIQAYRMDVAEQQLRSRRQFDQLSVAAQQAQQAYEATSGAAKAKAAEEARTAWNTAAEVAAATRQQWQADEQLAQAQAKAWGMVHDFAIVASTQQDWPGIADKAATTGTAWTDELAWAQEQARQWTELAERTRANATAIPVVPTI
ncbi:ALF repeat-containing protein [Actinoplanes sp. NPDC049681]|uniref:ALF repeat-containing protein n=1 Tax=Actinoplanes sp. NPDC049681 TaxID=3363905 RepID=UPI00379BF7D0